MLTVSWQFHIFFETFMAIGRISTMLLALLTLCSSAQAQVPRSAIPVGETPTILEHLEQADIESGAIGFRKLVSHGALLFDARFNALDGQGRPAATGNGTPTKRLIANNPGFLRTSGVDANSCSGCHNQPVIGGSGDFVANVFVLAQVRDPVTTSVDAEFSNERNTLGMNGAGAIEMLAREMTADLLSLKAAAAEQAQRTGLAVSKNLTTKGVNFGSITANPDQTFDTSAVVGVDSDLIIRPFHQKGVVVSLREFTNNAYNHHHGMQSVERFGSERTGSNDFDEDGYTDELTVGDITAATIYQAALGVPGRVTPSGSKRKAAVRRGRTKFKEVGCESCHISKMTLKSPIFSEANPYNPAGNLKPDQMQRKVKFNMTQQGLGPLLEEDKNGGAIVRAFTDLKRHVICDEQDSFFCNEKLVQGGVPKNQFITRKLWDVGNSAPYGHRGDLTTMSAAILHHSAEARESRDAYAALPVDQQNDIIEFLKSLQVLPEGSPIVVSEDDLLNRQELVREAMKIAMSTN